MSHTVFRALLMGMGLLIAGGVFLNSQRTVPDPVDAEMDLRRAIEGCGRGTGRWGGRIFEMRDPATSQVISRNLILDHDPDVGESESVLQAWFECHRTVHQPQHEMVFDDGKGDGLYYRTESGRGYFVRQGRIACINIGKTSRCTAQTAYGTNSRP
jgi:hypothetical protein